MVMMMMMLVTLHDDLLVDSVLYIYTYIYTYIFLMRIVYIQTEVHYIYGHCHKVRTICEWNKLT